MHLNKKKSWTYIILFTVVTLFLGSFALQVRVEDDIKKYIPQDDPQKIIYDEVSENFGLNTLILSAVEFEDASKHLNDIQDISDELKELEGVDNVISLINAPRINSNEFGEISVGNLKSSLDLKDYDSDEAKVMIMSDEMLKGKFISDDGNNVLIIIGLKDDADGLIIGDEVREIFENSNIKYHLLGTPLANGEIESIVKANLRTLVPLVTFLVALVLFFSFRTATGVILPIISVAIADIWTVGIMVLSGLTFNTTTAAVPVAVVGIGTAYAIHIISKYYEEVQKGLVGEQAVNETVKTVGTAVLLSAFTTIAGFLSLLTADLKPVWQLGIFTSIGIAISLLSATILVPSILLIISPKPRKKMSEEGESPFLKKITHGIVYHRVTTFTVIGVFIVLFSLYIPKITADTQIENFLNDKTEIVQSSKFLRNNFGGNDYIFIDFKADGDNSFRDFYFNRSLRDIITYSKSFNIISQTTDISEVVAKLTKGFTGTEYIPGSNAALEQNYMLIEGSEGIDKILKAEDNESVAQIMVNTEIFNRVESIYEELLNFEKEYILKEYSVEDFDTSNSDHLKAFENEIRRFVYARGGSYKDTLTQNIVDVKNMNVLKIIDKMNFDKFYNDFNKYITNYGEEEITKDELKAFLMGGENDFLSEYFEYYTFENEAKIKSDFAYSKIKNIDVGLNDEQIKELSQYVNDLQVPVQGGNNKLDVRITGIPILANEVNDMIFDNQTKSMILAYLFVFIIFSIQMRSIFVGLLSLIPISLTILSNFGIMGMTGISLNAATVTIASITIGAGIDYTIHYLTRFKIEYANLGDKFQAAVKTSATSGKAIIINSLAVVLGFATFIFSDIGMLRQFGILTASAMIIAPILTLTIFPMVMTLLSDKILGKFSKGSKIIKKLKDKGGN
ncbi:MMPL family transporter [Oceanotoga sp. DSM 15011]|uniref:efflux RND transporter permease subunit n=1 Tax=Oceanotoga sp. DSM 15011 TaxID=2984951 RepID=UPI0021F4E605|nr:MMPL family transporter [Oceanotoga sp. DSM 15011]UYO98847.1 MMPL family transporter [Oceanotoga sp. DSM 15011]